MPRHGNNSTRLPVKRLISDPPNKNESPTRISKVAKLSISNKRCFKCQVFRHFALECPNAKVISFVKEETLDEEEIDEEKCSKMKASKKSYRLLKENS